MSSPVLRVRFAVGVLLWASCSSAAPAFAATYWVSPQGQAAWSGCQSDSPLDGLAACSIITASANAAAGDTVYLRGGTYSGDTFIAPTHSGVAGSPITFSAYNHERVVVNNQRVPDADQESSGWSPWNGAEAQQSDARAWDGTYSTKFVTTSSSQGVRSHAFSLYREKAGLGYYYTFRVYSDQPSVNVQVRSTDGTTIPLNKDVSIVPNTWNTFSGYMLIGSPGQYYAVVASPAAAPSGTWYIDGIRINAYQAAIYLNGKDYIVVRGVEATSVVMGFDLRNGADYNEIGGSSFSDMMHGLFINNLVWDGNGSASRYNWVHDSVFHDSGWVQRRAGGATDCDDIQSLFVIGSTSGTDGSTFNLIENNDFYHSGHDLVIIRTQFNTFRNNRLHNEGWMYNREGPCQDVDGDPTTFNNPVMFGNRGLLFETPRNNGGMNLVEGNRIGFSGTPPDDDGANGIENPSDGNIVRYNFLFKNGGAGFYFKAQPGISGTDVMPDHNVIYNNTIYGNGGGVDITTARQAGLYFICGTVYTPTHPTGNVVKNNIVFGNTRSVAGASCEGYEYSNNFERDPLFANPDVSDPFSAVLPDLGLRTGSPAIDGGAGLTTVSAGDTGSGPTLAVVNARFFQDGSWGPPGKIQPDVIAVGHVGNTAQVVSIDYVNQLIALATPLSRQAGDPVWLSRKSDGALVLAGAGPDFGASEFGANAPRAPSDVIVR